MKLMLKSAKGRDLLLGLFFLAGVVLSLKSSSDDLPGWLRGTRAGSWLLQFSTGNQNIHDIAVGIIVSLFIYLSSLFGCRSAKSAKGYVGTSDFNMIRSRKDASRCS
jgi:hypothetical protein